MSLDDPATLRALGFAAAGSLLWLQYWDLKDRRRPEPRLRLLAAFLLGAGAAAAALGAYAALEAAGFAQFPAEGGTALLVYCVACVGLVEEASKFAVARATVFRWKVFDERVDGFVYAAAVALGFAAVENLFYLPRLGLGHQLVRTLCAPLVHTLFAAIWGYATAFALLGAHGPLARIGLQAGSVVLAAIVHGLYDYALFAGAPALVVAAIVLVLWTAVIAAARHALARDDDGDR